MVDVENTMVAKANSTGYLGNVALEMGETADSVKGHNTLDLLTKAGEDSKSIETPLGGVMVHCVVLMDVEIAKKSTACG